VILLLVLIIFINFSAIENFRNISHATNAGDRRLWIFNTDIQRLELFDYNQNKVITEFPPTNFPALELTSNFNVCWVKTKNTIDSYTVYGSLINSFPTDVEIQAISIYNEYVFALSNEKLVYKEKGVIEFLNLEIPEIKVKQFSIKDEILYIYDGQILTSYRQLLEIRESKKSIIQDRTIYEDAFIFAPNLHAMGLLTNRDYHNYRSLFDLMESVVDAPDLMIYLRSSIPNLVSQIHKRGRDYENSISIDYLSRLNERYEAWIHDYKKGKLLIIDVDNINFVDNPEDLGEIINKIDAQLHGLF